MNKVFKALAWIDENWSWRDCFEHRKAAGYTLKEDARHLWEKLLVWKVLDLTPRWLKYWVIVEVSTKNEMGNPGEVKTVDLLRRLSV